MSVAVQDSKKVWTEAELEALPNDGYIHEVVNGKLIMSPKNNFEHEHIVMRLSTALNTFAVQNRLGVVLGSNAGYWMHNRNCRAPDVSFLPRARLRSLGIKADTRTFINGAPDLAVEVISGSNTPAEIHERLEDYFRSGTQLAWLIHPKEQFVEICHSPIDRKILGAGADLHGENLLPGFKYPIADLFKEWDWE